MLLVFAWEKNDDSLYAEALLIYSLYLYYNGRYKEAEKRIVPAVELFETLSDETEENTLTAQQLMTCILDFAGNIPKALEMAEKMYNNKVAKVGEESPEIADVANNYAGVLEKAGRQKDAMIYYEKAYRLAKLEVGSGWIYHNNYAYALQNSGKYTEALPIRKQVKNFWRAKDENHPYAVYAMVGYADSLEKCGGTDEAIKIYEEALEKIKENELFEQDHPFIVSTKCSYAVALGKGSNMPEAINLIDYVIEKRTEKLGETHIDTLMAKFNKAGMLYTLGEYVMAYALQNDVISEKESFKNNEVGWLMAESLMAIIKSKMNDENLKAQAISEQENVLQKLIDNYGYETAETLSAMRVMGQVYEHCGKYKKAHDILAKALPKFERLYGVKSPVTRNIAVGIVVMLRSGKVPMTPFLRTEENTIRRKFGF